MAAYKMNFYLIVLVMCLQVLVPIVHGDDSSTKLRIPSHAEMTYYSNTESDVFHLEADNMIRGNILFSDGSSLKTTDGRTTTTISGTANRNGYDDWGGPQPVRFNLITGFAQQDKKRYVIVVDNGNHCLRLIDRKTQQVSQLAGACQQAGFVNGKNALFNLPWGVTRDSLRAKRYLIVTDTKNNAIREVNKNNGEVTTLFAARGGGGQMREPTGISQNPVTGDFYLTSQHAVYRYRYGDAQPIRLSGSDKEWGFMDGSDWTRKSFFNAPSDVLSLAGNKLVVADQYNSKLRVIDEKAGSVTSICSGDSGSRNGNTKSCQLVKPYSLLAMTGYLYVGEHRRIRKIQGEVGRSAWDRVDNLPTHPPTTTTTTTPTTTTPTTTTTTTTPTTTTTTPTTTATTPTTTTTATTTTTPTTTTTTPTTTTTTPTTTTTTPITTVTLPTTTPAATTTAQRSTSTAGFCKSQNTSVLLLPGQKMADIEIADGQVLSLAPGIYATEVSHNDLSLNCTSYILVTPAKKNVLSFWAQYKAPCGILNDRASRTVLAATTNEQYKKIEANCQQDCNKPSGVRAQFRCVGDVMTITWRTEAHGAPTTETLSELQTRLHHTYSKDDFTISVPVNSCRIVQPIEDLTGQYMHIDLMEK